MQKALQKFTSAFLAANMIFSIVATNFVAYAEEAPNALPASEEIMADDAVDPGDAVAAVSDDENIQDAGDSSDTAASAETPSEDKTATGESNSADSGEKEGTDTAKSAPSEETQEKEETKPEDTNSEKTVEPTESPVPTETPDTDKSSEQTENPEPSETPEPETEEFVALQVVTPEYGDNITAEFGDTVTLDALLNRDDVNVTYQWQVKRNYVADDSYAIYPYEEGEPTWYDFVWEDSTEAKTLAVTPDFVWQGCEMYYAIVDALDEIGADSSNVRIAWHTPNFVLDGYAITAASTDDGTVEVYASNGENTYTAHLNDDGQWEFSEEATAALPTEWQNIEGATEASYSFEFTEDEMYNTYQCIVTVADDKYREENFAAIEKLGTELTEEEKAKDITLLTVQFKVQPTDESAEQLAEERVPTSYAMLANTFSGRNGAGTPSLSSDNQWITGLNGSYEYLTKAMYDKVTQWLNEGSIDQTQANRYWTQIGDGGFKKNLFYANVLDSNGFPTGATRQYNGFDLTDGHMLEVNSEWYGQTVYFRPHNDASAWSVTGTAIDVPAYTSVIRDADKGNYGTGASGTKYKDSVVFLNPWVSDAGRMYAKFLSHPAVSNNGWLKGPNGETLNQHITVLSIPVEMFNSDPDRYMMDAEGNYRIDSIGWGVCVGKEPDVSGKAYYAIKDFLSKGYGMCVGHDTMYAYAGSWYDAHGNASYGEGKANGPDRNDGTTRYYVLNSAPSVSNGHWNMNALMGSNDGNIDSGNILPTDAVSMILSSGGSHGKYGKSGIMYGSNELSVQLKPYSYAQAQSTVKFRNPTNFPYDIPSNFSSSPTHTNSQVAFGPIWVNYAGGNKVGEEYGYNNSPTTKTITDTKTGRTWFGTSNFYLSGTGNFLMNQIGHLPENSATQGEASLFANTVMYVSQRKQCEICAANQNGQEDSHFVIRVSSVNYQEVLSALQNGGNFWYPLNGCYQVVDDLTLPEGWEPIKNFSGHWNSDAYHVNLASNGMPLFDNTQTKNENGWNLGTDKAKGVVAVFKNTNPATRTTGIARVLGDLNALFNQENTDYTGYTVKILGKDNPRYLSNNEEYTCKVNSDNKYVISNLPCIYEGSGKGVLFARVYDRNNREVTEYGDILVNVSTSYWFNCETTPLYLGNFESFPTNDYTTYESAQGIFESSAVSSSKFEAKKWQYRENNTAEWKDVPSDWDTSVKTTVHDPAVAGSGVDLYTVTTKLTLNQVKPSWDGYQFRAVYSNGKATWNSFGYYFKGAIASNDSFDGAVYKEINEPGKTGTLRVKLWPAYAEQGADVKVAEAGTATFRVYGYALSDGTQISVSWQYGTLNRLENGKPIYDWKDISSSDEFGGLQKVSTSSPKRNTRSEIDNALLNVAGDNDLNLFHNKAGFYGIESKLTIYKVDIDQTNYHFRAHFTAKSKNGTSYDWYSDIADETAGVYTTSDGNFATHGVTIKKDNSNKLTVIPPDLRAVTTPSASFNEGKTNPDLMTPDEYGQTLLLPTVTSTLCNGTAAYQSILYYKAEELTPTPTWQYMTYTDRRARNWDQNVARSLGYSNITVKVQNSAPFDAVYKGESGWKAIKSTMYISNAPITMYNSENLLKYYFRCIGTMNYETVRRQKSLSAADKWGGLSMDYSIAIWHNGVIGYNNTNKINGSTVTDSDGLIAATKNRSYSDWYYPKLAIKVPAGHHVNTVIVSFENMSSSDSILVDSGSLNRLGITVSQASSSYVVLVSGAKNRVEISTWQKALQNYVGFRSYDKVNYSKEGILNGTCGGATVKWLVDENRLAGVTYDPDSGHFYKVVDMGNNVSWETARQRAATYDSELGMSGYLAEIGSAKENALVHNIVGGRNAWLGGTRSGNWWHWHNSNSGFRYSNWQSGAQTGNANLFMTPSGTWNSGPVSVTNTVTVPAWSDTSDVLVKVQPPADNSSKWEHENYVDYSKEIAIPENYRGRTATFLIDYWQAWQFTGGCAHGYYSKYSGFKLSVEGWYDGAWHRIAGEWTGGEYEDTYSTSQKLGPDGAWHYCIDLTIPSNVSWIRTKIQGDGCSQHLQTAVNVFCNGWTKTVTGYSNPCTAAVIEYEPQALAFATTNHSATDTTVIGTNATSNIVTNSKIVSANIKGNTKVYDGKPISPSSFVVTGSTTGANASLFNVQIEAAEVGNNAGYATRNVNGANYTDTGAVNATRYHVTVSLTQEAINAGWQLDESQSSLECDLIINQRPIDVYSYHNNKTYDGTTTGTINGITFRGASGDKGVVNGDSVRLNTTTVSGTYIDKNGSATIHNSVSNNSNNEYTMSRNTVVSTLAIVHDASSDPHYNYILGNEDYTGAIAQRPLYLHSLYKEDPNVLRNVKTYDGTTEATIQNIIIDNVLDIDSIGLTKETLSGNYATRDAGELLDENGKVKPNRLANLTEVTITQSETPVLTNNPYGDYYIASQRYSGAIARASLTAQVKNWRGLYGDGVGEKPWHDTKDYKSETPITDGCWLEIDGLAKNDTLKLDETKSNFKTLVEGHEDLVPDTTTAVGVYPLTYVGLTEQNYDILKNYVVMVLNGRFEVEPRPIRITVVDDDKLVYQQNPNFHVKIQLENVDGSLTDVTSDVDANPILNAALKGNDKICDTLFVLKDGVEEAITQDFETNYDGWKKDEVPESKTNIPFTTDCNEESLPRYANGTPGDNFDWVEEAATCGFCDCKHKDLAPYQVLINTDPEAGAALVVRKVTNLNGEQVSNYTLDIVEGRLFVHPALLKVTVPLYVCMYGYNSSGEVVEPTNYRVVNYSTVPIRIKNINVHGNWTVKDVPGIESYDKGDYSSSYYQPTNNTLKNGELYMRMRNTALHEGDNPIESSNTAWVIPRATGNFVTGDITGVGMRIPMAVYTASGNVNEAKECTPVTKVTYTVLPYGGKMQDASQYESVPNPFYDPNAGGTGSGS